MASTSVELERPNFSTNENDWIPLTRSILQRQGRAVWERLSREYSGLSLAYEFWSEVGVVFEQAALSSIEMSSNSANYGGTVPDATGTIYNGKWWEGFANKAIFIEVKVSATVPNKERDTEQLLRMLRYLGEHRVQKSGIAPALVLVTPSRTLIKKDLIREATNQHVVLLQAETEVLASDQRIIRVGKARPLNKIEHGWDAGSMLWRTGRPAPINL